MEDLVSPQFWAGRRVLVTGHTGFKGAWLCLWLQKLGASVAGYALPASADQSLFALARVGDHLRSVLADVRDRRQLAECVASFDPEVIFHLAAQPLVRDSYQQPIETYEVNVLGTAHLLESVRQSRSCLAVVVITSDKCYENKEWVWGYRETDRVGGHDPYSSSKACAELVTAAYRTSFFESDSRTPIVAVASARAGNVIGGGDFARDRLVPDVLAASRGGKALRIRNPDAVRPWPHVLEPLSGYLRLAELLCSDPRSFSGSWNFGPGASDARPVRWIVERLAQYLDGELRWHVDAEQGPHEARLLMLDSSKAHACLGWRPRWRLAQALQAVAEWHKACLRNESLHDVTLRQILEYEKAPAYDASIDE